MGEHTTGIVGHLNPVCFALQQVAAKREENIQRFQGAQASQEQVCRAGPSPEDADELSCHQLRAQLLHLCHVAQQAQHVAVQLLLLWELLSKQRAALWRKAECCP